MGWVVVGSNVISRLDSLYLGVHSKYTLKHTSGWGPKRRVCSSQEAPLLGECT